MNSIATICPFHGATGWKDPQDEISIVFYLQTVGSQEAQKILPARGTTCISSQLCTIIMMISFAFYSFRTPLKLVLNSFESIFSRNTYTFIYFYSVLCLCWQDLTRLITYYQPEVHLAYLVDFAQFLIWFAPHFTFLQSKLQFYTPWNYFLQGYIYSYFSYLVLYLWLVGS